MRVRRSATRTLLLDGLDDLAQVTEGLEDWPTEPPDEGLGELVELPVTCPDIESVARHCDLDLDEVMRRHRESEDVVAFCGFAPGFAYLTGLPEDLPEDLPMRAQLRPGDEFTLRVV